jgi:hypothetical protein
MAVNYIARLARPQKSNSKSFVHSNVEFTVLLSKKEIYMSIILLAHSLLTCDVSTSIKSSLSTGITNINSVYSGLRLSSEIHTMTIDFKLDPIRWFKVFTKSGIFLAFSVMFQASRSVFGGDFQTKQLNAQAYFFFIILILRVIDQGNTSADVTFSQLQNFGLFPMYTFINLDLFSSFLIKFWNGKVIQNSFPLIFNHTIYLVVKCVPVEYDLKQFYDKDSDLWSDIDPVFVKGILMNLKPISINSKNYPNGTFLSTQMFDLFEPRKFTRQTTLWYMFLNHTDNTIQTDKVDSMWLNSNFDVSPLMAGTPNLITVDGKVQSFSGLLSNINNINPVTTVMCMQLLQVSYDFTSTSSFFSLVSVYSPILTPCSSYINNYIIDRDVVSNIIGFTNTPMKSMASQERSNKRVKRSEKPKQADKSADSDPEGSSLPYSVSLKPKQIRGVTRNTFDNPLLSGIKPQELNLLLKTFVSVLNCIDIKTKTNSVAGTFHLQN